MITIKAKNYKDDGNNCYFVKFYTFDNKVISKVGTSTRSIFARIKQEINDYKRKGFDICEAVIESVIDCGKNPPHGAESIARAMFIKKHPENYVQNDRFIGVDIPVKDFNNIVTAYLAN